jgi:hypothetical protein
LAVSPEKGRRVVFDNVPVADYCEYDDKQLPQQTYRLMTIISKGRRCTTEHLLPFKPSEHKVHENNF